MYYRDNFNYVDDYDYEEFRNEANNLVNKHRSLSQLSKNAFQSGDKERGHDLSKESEQILEQAKDMSCRAAEDVFRMNNSDRAANEIDLHGLHVKEADHIL